MLNQMNLKKTQGEPEYFVSLMAMTKGGMPTGHAFIGVSAYQPGQDHMALIMNAGFYPEKMAVLGFKPFSPGRVITETPRYVQSEGVKHLSWPITAEQKDRLIKKLNLAKIHTQQYESHRNQTPYARFNAFNHNCKRFSMAIIADVLDFDLEYLGNWLTDIPKWTPNLNPGKIKAVAESASQYWNIPMVIDTQLINDPNKTERYQNWSKFNVLYYGIKAARDALNKKIEQMHRQEYPTLSAVLARLNKPLKKETTSAICHATLEMIDKALASNKHNVSETEPLKLIADKLREINTHYSANHIDKLSHKKLYKIVNQAVTNHLPVTHDSDCEKLVAVRNQFQEKLKAMTPFKTKLSEITAERMQDWYANANELANVLSETKQTIKKPSVIDWISDCYKRFMSCFSLMAWLDNRQADNLSTQQTYQTINENFINKVLTAASDSPVVKPRCR